MDSFSAWFLSDDNNDEKGCLNSIDLNEIGSLIDSSFSNSFDLEPDVIFPDTAFPSQESSADAQNTPTIEPDSQPDQAVLTSNGNDGFEVLPAIIDKVFNSHVQQQNEQNSYCQAQLPESEDYKRYKHIPGFLIPADHPRYEEVKWDLAKKFISVPWGRLHTIFEQFCSYLNMRALFKEYSRAASRKRGVMFEFFTNHSQDFRIFLAQTSFSFTSEKSV